MIRLVTVTSIPEFLIMQAVMLQSGVPIPQEPLSNDILLETAIAASQEAGALLLTYAGDRLPRRVQEPDQSGD